ncbi:MAG: Succinate dehydrogenase cytochrome b558 subunit [Candidatus Anoxychlamydiales bacterium]|nr:Succinate dehydrogenase cytochrome b558 subunit [Candidatus Anoxychlamydiales bacterium]NGX35186.1 Succinate dehydrogenase cytochrome b558 subunit [Candidatus Anoxychlamydiales bacterium]
MMITKKIPISFVFRRLQSLTGFFLTLFLFEHLMTNSTASLFLDKGHFFIKAVSAFQAIPYLKFVEITLIGIPLLFHASLGIKYITTGEVNSFKTDGKKAALYQYKRNKAYTWQRITSYIVAILLIFHIVQMRFINSPKKVTLNKSTYFLVKIKKDAKLDALAASMGAKIFSKDETKFLDEKFQKMKLKNFQVLAFTKESGQAFLLEVRDTFKNPFMVGIYSLFVVAASFHALNGLWTFLMSWGFIISNRSQSISLRICFWAMIAIISLGFISIWSSFFY